MGRIYLIRHGEVEWNRVATYIGVTDMPLNSTGIAQAQQVAQRLRGENMGVVYCSHLIRSQKTAEIIAEKLNVEVRLLTELRELSYGDWEGVPEAEIHARFPEEFAQWRANPAGVAIPGGESLGELRDRVFPAFVQIAETHQAENVAIVSHKTANRVIICCALGLDINRYRQIGQGNGCISVIERRANSTLVVNTINDCCHVPGTKL